VISEKTLVAVHDIAAASTVWLIPHVLTFSATMDARKAVQSDPDLAARIRGMRWCGKDDNDVAVDSESVVVEAALDAIWELAIPLRAARAVKWYVEDEAGALLPTGDHEGNLGNAIIQLEDASFTAVWPIRPIRSSEKGVRSPPSNAWALRSHSVRLLVDSCKADTAAWTSRLETWASEKDSSYVPDTGAINLEALLPELDLAGSEARTVDVACSDAPLKLYTSKDYVRDTLTDPRFQIVDLPEEADAFFTHEYFTQAFVNAARGDDKDVRWRTSPQRVVANQFPFEGCLCQKDHLHSNTLARAGFGTALWCPRTYDLDDLTQLRACLGEMNEGNGSSSPVFIVKPANMNRSIGHTVTDRPSCVLAHGIAKGYIAQRYLKNPSLFRNRKFDLRVVAIIRPCHETDEAAALEVLVHRHTWVRVANKPHTVARDALDDVENVLTAMHLLDGVEKPNHPSLTEFIMDFESSNGPGSWSTTETKIRNVVLKIFSAAFSQQPGFRTAVKYGSRAAVYGLDFMIDFNPETTIPEVSAPSCEPVLLEVTFDPSCLATSPVMPDVQFRDNYANDLMAALFLAETSPRLISLGVIR
jgi:tubulin--tyrosine ligase-like protein 12